MDTYWYFLSLNEYPCLSVHKQFSWFVTIFAASQLIIEQQRLEEEKKKKKKIESSTNYAYNALHLWNKVLNHIY